MSFLVANPEDRFSPDEAHLFSCECLKVENQKIGCYKSKQRVQYLVGCALIKLSSNKTE